MRGVLVLKPVDHQRFAVRSDERVPVVVLDMNVNLFDLFTWVHCRQRGDVLGECGERCRRALDDQRHVLSAHPSFARSPHHPNRSQKAVVRGGISPTR